MDGKNMDMEMIHKDLAEAYRGRPPSGFDINLYQSAEKESRDAGRGMWSLEGSVCESEGVTETSKGIIEKL